MPTPTPSLYEILLGNFTGGLPLWKVGEHDQHTLSVLDNVQRILDCREGTLSHLPEYGLPDMSEILAGLPATAQGLIATMTRRLLRYEPRLSAVDIHLQAQIQPGHLEYRLEARLKRGAVATFATTLGPDGRAMVRHLKQQFAAREALP